MKPDRWTLTELLSADLAKADVAVWSSQKVDANVKSRLPWCIRPPLEPLPAEVKTLVVVGGGVLMDESKAWRYDHAPELRLIAIPSIWGSGAEASSIVVLNREGKKQIRSDVAFLPDVRVVWPELAENLPASLAKAACGDAWSHALEGFLSALGCGDLRTEVADLIREMLGLPLAYDTGWFDASAKACAAQARSSVGLVHGIAHVLEGILTADQPNGGWGHARLCSLMLWPVISFNAQASEKFSNTLAAHDLDESALLQVCEQLFEPEAYEAALPALEANWRTILRDPCSRTNSALVRPNSIEFFTSKAFT